MKVLGLISSLTDPSSRARILQYGPYLQQEGIALSPRYFSLHAYADPARWMFRMNKITRINPWRLLTIQKNLSRLPLLREQHNYDIIWQNRLVIPHQSYYERKFKKPVVFDFDDAIWLHDGEKNVAEAIERSDMIFAGNGYLADFARKYNNNIHLIPSVIDTDRLFPLTNRPAQFTIGWIGSVSNLRFLELAKPAILDFLSNNKDSRLLIVTSEKKGPFTFDDDRIHFKKWSAETENELINEFSIGLMPLEDNEFTTGKCSYKMLQYMACGKPVIVSPVGMNNNILHACMTGFSASTTTEWLKAMNTLKNDRELYQAFAGNGRAYIQREYALDKYAPIIAGKLIALENRGKKNKSDG